MTKKRPRKAKRAPAAVPDAEIKSTSMRFLVTPEQVSMWNEAAHLTHEGNLSMFARQTLDAAARAAIEKAKQP